MNLVRESNGKLHKCGTGVRNALTPTAGGRTGSRGSFVAFAAWPNSVTTSVLFLLIRMDQSNCGIVSCSC